jgi:hypothetical protein
MNAVWGIYLSRREGRRGASVPVDIGAIFKVTIILDRSLRGVYKYKVLISQYFYRS